MLDLNNEVLYRTADKGQLKVKIDKDKDYYFFPYVVATGSTDSNEILSFNAVVRERIFTGKRTILVKPLGWETTTVPLNSETNEPIDIDKFKSLSNVEPIKPENYDELELTDEDRVNYDILKADYDTYQQLAKNLKNCQGKKSFKVGNWVVGKILPPATISNDFVTDDDGYVRQVQQSTLRVRFDDSQKESENIGSFVWRSDSKTIKKDNISLLWLCPELNGNDLFYIQSIQIFLHPKTSEYMWHDITFKSVQESLRTIGKTIRNAIQFGQPGETYFKPNVISTSTESVLKKDDNGNVLYDVNNNPIYEEIPQTKRVPTLEDIENDLTKLKEDDNYEPIFFEGSKGINSFQIETDGAVVLLASEVYGRKKERDPSIVNITTPLWIEKFLTPQVTPLSKNYQYEQQHLIVPDGTFASINYALNWKQDQEINFNPNDKRHNRGTLLSESFENKVWNKGWYGSAPYINKLTEYHDLGNVAVDGLKVDILNVVHLMNYINFRVADNTLYVSTVNDVSNVRYHGGFDIKKDEWQLRDYTALASATNLFFDKSVELDGHITYDSAGSIIEDNNKRNSSNLPVFTNATKADCLNYMNLINKKIVTLEPHRVKWEDYRGYYFAWIKIAVTAFSFFILFAPGKGLVKLLGGAIAQQLAPQITNFIPAEVGTYRSLISNGLSFSFPYMISRSVLDSSLVNLPRTTTGIPIVMFSTYDNPFSQVLDTSQFRDVFHFQLTDKVMTYEAQGGKLEEVNLTDVVKGDKHIKLGYNQTTISLPKTKDTQFIIDGILLKMIGNRTIKITFYDDEGNVVYYYETETQSEWSGNVREVSNLLLFNYTNDNYTDLDAYKENSVLDNKIQPIVDLQLGVSYEQKLSLYNDIINKINIKYLADKANIETLTDADDLLEKKEKINIYTEFKVEFNDIEDSEEIIIADTTPALKTELISLIDTKLNQIYNNLASDIVDSVKLNYKLENYLDNTEKTVLLNNFPNAIEKRLLYIIETHKSLYLFDKQINSFSITSSNDSFNLDGISKPQDILDLIEKVKTNTILSDDEKIENERLLLTELMKISEVYEQASKLLLNRTPSFISDYKILADIIQNAKTYYFFDDTSNNLPTKPSNWDSLDINNYDKYKYTHFDNIFTATKEKILNSLQIGFTNETNTAISNINNEYNILYEKIKTRVDNAYDDYEQYIKTPDTYDSIITNSEVVTLLGAYTTLYGNNPTHTHYSGAKTILTPYFGNTLWTKIDEIAIVTTPDDSTDSTTPDDSTDTTEPDDSTDSTTPDDSTDTTEPDDSTGTTTPDDSTGTTEPQVFTSNEEKFKTTSKDLFDTSTKDIDTLKAEIKTYTDNKNTEVNVVNTNILLNDLSYHFAEKETLYTDIEDLDKTVKSKRFLRLQSRGYSPSAPITTSGKPTASMNDYPFYDFDYNNYKSWFTYEFDYNQTLLRVNHLSKTEGRNDLFNWGRSFDFATINSRYDNSTEWYNHRSNRLRYIQETNRNISSNSASADGKSKYKWSAYIWSVGIKNVSPYIPISSITFKSTVNAIPLDNYEFQKIGYRTHTIGGTSRITKDIQEEYVITGRIKLSRDNILKNSKKPIKNKIIININNDSEWHFALRYGVDPVLFSFKHNYDKTDNFNVSNNEINNSKLISLSLNSMRIYALRGQTGRLAVFSLLEEPIFIWTKLSYTLPYLKSEELNNLKQLYVDSIVKSDADFWAKNTDDVINNTNTIFDETKIKEYIDSKPTNPNSTNIIKDILKEPYTLAERYINSHISFKEFRKRLNTKLGTTVDEISYSGYK